MKQIGYIVFLLPLFWATPIFSQCSYSGVKEIDCVRDSILKLHQNEDFYFYIRFLPSVRASTDEFVLTKKNDNWTAKYYKTTTKPPPWIGTNHTRRKTKLKISEMKDSSLTSFLNSIDVNRLVNYKNSDSVSLDNSKILLGTFNYFLIICSNANVKLIEYPIFQHYDRNKDLKTQPIYWQSNYLDDLIAKIKQAFSK